MDIAARLKHLKYGYRADPQTKAEKEDNVSMNLTYPSYIPAPGKEKEFDEGSHPGLRVGTAAEHKRLNPGHYDKALAYVPPTPLTMDQAVKVERERCAGVAEAYGATQAALAIRGAGLPPTLEAVLAAGYNEDAAKQIVAEERAKFAAGYPPYGTNDPPAATKVTAVAIPEESTEHLPADVVAASTSTAGPLVDPLA